MFVTLYCIDIVNNIVTYCVGALSFYKLSSQIHGHYLYSLTMKCIIDYENKV